MAQYKYRQITPDRTISSVESYSAGEIIFKFQVTGDKVWHPKNTVLRARCKLSRNDGSHLNLGDEIGVNMDFLAATMQRIELRCNNRVVQSIDSYVGQTDMLYKRINRSREWLDGVGADCEYTEAQIHKRINRFAIDGFVNTLTNVITGAPLLATCFEPSERLLNFECMWRPGMEVFDQQLLGAGNWSLHCVPLSNSNDIQRNAIESITALLVPGPTGDFLFNMTNLYLDVAESVVPGYSQPSLKLRNIRCHPVPYTQGVNSFIPTTVQVGLNCTGLTFAIQGSAYDTNTRSSATKFTLPLSAAFTTTGYAETSLTQLNMNFKNMNAFDQDVAPEYTFGSINYLRELYNHNLLSLGRYGDVKSGESFDDWIQRGIFVYAPFEDGTMAKDSSAVVRCKFSADLNLNDVARILVFSHENVRVEFSAESGIIVDSQIVPV